MTEEMKAAFENLLCGIHYDEMPSHEKDLALIRHEFETLEWIAEQAIDTYCPPRKVAISCEDMSVCGMCWRDAARKAMEEEE